MNRFTKISIFLYLICLGLYSFAQGVERFPKPDFESEYTRPAISTSAARSTTMEYVDSLVLFLALSLASFFAIKRRSRRDIFLLMLFCIAYFGYYRKGCVCSVGSIQNVTLALFNNGYAIPVAVIVFFILPLIFTLFFGRTFCASVCPLGGIQDLVILKNTRIPLKLSAVLSMLPYLYLGLALLFAANGAGFIICQYDPFIGFFRFGATFNMLLLGAAFLLLGTVVARPYCRFLCPYGVVLNWMSVLSRRHVTISPDTCSNCRLCEASCPVDAIRVPDDFDGTADKKRETTRFILLLLMLPLFMAASGWMVSRMNLRLSKQHQTVWLAEQLQLENSGEITTQSDETKAFRASGKPLDVLLEEAEQIRHNFSLGGWVLGGLLCLILYLKFMNLSIRKKRLEYEIDKGSCVSCGKCFIYCPYEKVRLGILSPEDIDNY